MSLFRSYLVLDLTEAHTDSRYVVLDYGQFPVTMQRPLEVFADELQHQGLHQSAAELRAALNNPAAAPSQSADRWTLRVYTAVWSGEGGSPQIAVHPVLVGPDDRGRDEQYHKALTDKAERQGHIPGTPLLTLAEVFEVNTLRQP